MLTVIGVRFRAAGKIYYFDPADRQIKIGDHVIVEMPEVLNTVT